MRKNLKWGGGGIGDFWSLKNSPSDASRPRDVLIFCWGHHLENVKTTCRNLLIHFVKTFFYGSRFVVTTKIPGL